MCKVHSCCRNKGLEHCGRCPDFPCERLGKMGDFRDLNTNNVKQRTCSSIAKSGFDTWYAEYSARAALLTQALERYNDGRMKRFLCELFIQQDLSVLTEIMNNAEEITGTDKERGKQFRSIVQTVLDSQQFQKQPL